MSIDNFISAVKAKRVDAVETFMSSEATKAIIEVGATTEVEMRETVTQSLDQLAGGILDIIEEQYGDIITAANDEGEDVTVSCASDLSTLYFEEVSN